MQKTATYLYTEGRKPASDEEIDFLLCDPKKIAKVARNLSPEKKSLLYRAVLTYLATYPLTDRHIGVFRTFEFLPGITYSELMQLLEVVPGIKNFTFVGKYSLSDGFIFQKFVYICLPINNKHEASREFDTLYREVCAANKTGEWRYRFLESLHLDFRNFESYNKNFVYCLCNSRDPVLGSSGIVAGTRAILKQDWDDELMETRLKYLLEELALSCHLSTFMPPFYELGKLDAELLQRVMPWIRAAIEKAPPYIQRCYMPFCENQPPPTNELFIRLSASREFFTEAEKVQDSDQLSKLIGKVQLLDDREQQNARLRFLAHSLDLGFFTYSLPQHERESAFKRCDLAIDEYPKIHLSTLMRVEEAAFTNR
jgi:hypothetical protein